MFNTVEKIMKKKWLWIVIFVYIAFIFSNSLQAGTSSGSFSASITTWILNFISNFNLSFDFDTFHHFIRKLAHFSEYAILGVLVMIASKKQPLIKNFKLNYLIFCILPPSIDETIQHFVPGRYGTIKDVLLDISGFLCASIIVYFIIKLNNKKEVV